MSESTTSPRDNKAAGSKPDLPAELLEVLQRIRECRPPAPVRPPSTPRRAGTYGLTDDDYADFAGKLGAVSTCSLTDDDYADFAGQFAAVAEVLASKSRRVRGRRRRKLAEAWGITVEQLIALLNTVTDEQVAACAELMRVEAEALMRVVRAEWAAKAARRDAEWAAMLEEMMPEIEADEAAAPRYAYLSGDTYPIREAIRARGWRWDAERKAWYLMLDGERGTPPEILADLRKDEPFAGRKLKVEIEKGYRR
jgi:hypothetical protein